MTEKSGGALARVYADALFELAAEKHAVDERLDEVRTLLAVFAGRPGLRPVLESPKIDGARKAAMVRDVFGDRFSRDLLNLVLLLIEKNRPSLLTAILESFEDRCDEESGRLQARVTTAVPLENAEAELLSRGLSDKTRMEIVLDRRVDPEVLGGAVLRFGDFIVDGSLKRRLERLRDDLLTPSEQ
ncbi:MAG: ATP synthase F1 subunit delta [Candidatus Eisenbacteria bacterium]